MVTLFPSTWVTGAYDIDTLSAAINAERQRLAAITRNESVPDGQAIGLWGVSSPGRSTGGALARGHAVPQAEQVIGQPSLRV